jgi:hypothetical protein
LAKYASVVVTIVATTLALTAPIGSAAHVIAM